MQEFKRENQAYRLISISPTSPSSTFPQTPTGSTGGFRAQQAYWDHVVFCPLLCAALFHRLGQSMCAFTQQGMGGVKESSTESPYIGQWEPRVGPQSCSLSYVLLCPLQLPPLSPCNKDPTDSPLLPRLYRHGFTCDFPSPNLCRIYGNEWRCVSF